MEVVPASAIKGSPASSSHTSGFSPNTPASREGLFPFSMPRLVFFLFPWLCLISSISLKHLTPFAAIIGHQFHCFLKTFPDFSSPDGVSSSFLSFLIFFF